MFAYNGLALCPVTFTKDCPTDYYPRHSDLGCLKRQSLGKRGGIRQINSPDTLRIPSYALFALFRSRSPSQCDYPGYYVLPRNPFLMQDAAIRCFISNGIIVTTDIQRKQSLANNPRNCEDD